MSRLAATVYVHDPTTHEWVTCEAGTEPEPRLAALITNPSAWEEGHVPAPEPDPPATETEPPAGDGTPQEELAAEKKPRTRRTTTEDKSE